MKLRAIRSIICATFFVFPWTSPAQGEHGPSVPHAPRQVFDVEQLSIWPQPSSAPARSRPGEPISVNELSIPPNALKELRAAEKDFAAGKFSDSARHLERAIRINVHLPIAHYDLGVCYKLMRQYDKAVVEFQTASMEDSRMIQPILGLTISLLLLQRYSEAEAAARRALEMDSQNSSAHLLLAQALLKRNATDEAVSELRVYLQQPNVANKERVSCMVERLTRPPDRTTCSLN